MSAEDRQTSFDDMITLVLDAVTAGPWGPAVTLSPLFRLLALEGAEDLSCSGR